ncbi:MAG: TonB-dependent receptor [Chlorobi bacterium]|nr:TonB-dependent receptor [Chlorobiota bacterium]
MKISLFLLFVSVLQLFAVNNYGQSKKLSLSMEKVTIADVLQAIQDQSEFKFFYNDQLVNVTRKVSVKAHKKDIWHVLNQVLPDAGITYRVVGKQVALFKGNSAYGNKNVQQPYTVTGKVADEKGEPLTGVNIIEQRTTNGTVSDANGSFSLQISSLNATLVFSYVGYRTKEVLLNGQTTIEIKLAEDILGLDQVVVIGYGTQKIKDVTGAISTITSKDIKDRPVLRFENALEGKMAGVQVISPSGKPQNTAFIRIRGTTSIDGSSEPLYVVDGVPTEDLLTLNPNDIENITILKDASSAAIYGASGANGVVIINTKRGKNKKATVNFNTYYGFSKVTKYLDVLHSSEYIDLMDELGLTTDWSIYTANTDWQREIYRNAVNQNYQLSVSGSDDKTNYYISGNWSKKDGIVRNNYADRYSAKVNFDRHINQWLKVGTSILFGKWHDVNIVDNIGAARGGVILGALETPELIGIYNPDGTFTGNPLQLSWENPVASTDAPVQDYYESNFLGNFYFQASFLKDFKFKTLTSYDYAGGQYSYFLDPFRTDWGRANQGIGEESSSKNQYWYNENTLTYTKKIKKHTLNALAGFIVSKRHSRSLYVQTTHFANDVIKTINGGSRIEDVNSSFAERSNVSQIARINYDYANKYLITANFRADASSVFGTDKRWGYFPSFSAGWRLSEEAFLKNSKTIDDLKIRFGWGQVGNDRIAEYAWYGRIGSGYDYVIGGVIQPGIAPETLENKDLKWETTTQTNLGVDVMLLGYRLGLTADAYLKNTSDLLLSMPIPVSTGFESTIQNVGKIRNKGVELLVHSKNLMNEFKWNTDLTFSLNRNEVVYLGDQIIHSGYVYQRGNVTIAKEGKSLGSFYGYVSQGVDPNTGMMIYKDSNGDDAITDEDKEIIGDANPKFVYGLNNTFSFKGFDLSLFIQGVYGNDIFNASRVETESMFDFKNQLATVLGRWENPGDVTDMPKAVLGEKYNSELSTRFLEDGSYLRIKTLTISYTLPVNIIRSMHLARTRIYMTAENLYTFTGYSGYDPEVNAFGGNNLAQGVDFGTYPQPRSIIFGIDLSF